MLNVDVIIVGAGPVGTVAAYALASKGVSVAICESGKNCARDLRASTFHAPTLEMLADLGLADDIIEYGIKAPQYHYRERRSGEVVEFDMTELADQTRFPYRIQCEQHVMAEMLAEKLEQHSQAHVLFEHRALGFSQDDNGIEAWFETPFTIERIKGRYLIGADGGNSLIRKWLGAQFSGFTYPEKFLCLSTRAELSDHIEGLAYVNYVADPDEWLVLLRAPSAWRVLLPADENIPDNALLSDETRRAVFERLIGRGDIDTIHRTIYRVHQRVVEQFAHGRVFLVGDAAHLNNPLGGLGMNSGIHDVWNLKPRLLKCLNQGHDDETFRQFDRQRRSVTNSFIQMQTMRNKELLEHGAAEGHEMRFARMKAIKDNPEKRLAFLLQQSMITSLRQAEQID